MPQKPKLLLVTKLYHPWIGGVEKHVQDLAEGLAKDFADDFGVKVLCCDERPSFSSLFEISNLKFEMIGGIPVYKAPSLGRLWSMPISPAFPFWLKKLSKEADIVHFHLPFPLAVFSYWLLRVFNLKSQISNFKLVATWHSDIVRQKLAALLLAPWTRWFLKQTDRIIVTSNNLLKNSPSLRDFKDKCSVIYLGIKIEDFAATPEVVSKAETIRKTHGNKPILLFVGRLVPYKGLKYLLEAMSMLESEAKLLIIGEGPLRARLEQQAKKLGLNGKVSFLGALKGQNLVPYYHACDVFVLPSITNNEAFGLVQLEAMACGKPVINTNLPTGVSEASLDSQSGLTIPFIDAESLNKAIEKIITNEMLKTKFGQTARQRAEKFFSIKQMFTTTTLLYHQVL
ncbi:MAG: glycosyltransferase [Elusimicrobia bacterium]|nr:glycosyltransferase [Elusimicrobiota bacterium]